MDGDVNVDVDVSWMRAQGVGLLGHGRGRRAWARAAVSVYVRASLVSRRAAVVRSFAAGLVLVRWQPTGTQDTPEQRRIADICTLSHARTSARPFRLPTGAAGLLATTRRPPRTPWRRPAPTHAAAAAAAVAAAAGGRVPGGGRGVRDNDDRPGRHVTQWRRRVAKSARPAPRLHKPLGAPRFSKSPSLFLTRGLSKSES